MTPQGSADSATLTGKWLMIFPDKASSNPPSVPSSPAGLLRGHLLPGRLLAAPGAQRAVAPARRAAAHALLGALHLAAAGWSVCWVKLTKNQWLVE